MAEERHHHSRRHSLMGLWQEGVNPLHVNVTHWVNGPEGIAQGLRIIGYGIMSLALSLVLCAVIIAGGLP